MGGISCWRNGRGSRSHGRPPRKSPRPTLSRPSGRTGRAPPFAGNGRPGMQARTAAVPDRGQIGSPGGGPVIFRLSPDALHGVTGRKGRRTPRGRTSAAWRRFRPSPTRGKRCHHHRHGPRRACRRRRARPGPAGRLTGRERPCLCCRTTRNVRLMSPCHKDAALMAPHHKIAALWRRAIRICRAAGRQGMPALWRSTTRPAPCVVAP